MKNKNFLFKGVLMAASLFCVHHSAQAQYEDTILNYPFLYLYDWQNNALFNSTNTNECSIVDFWTDNDISYIDGNYQNRGRKIAFLQHNSNNTLKAVGIACGHVHNYMALYDDEMSLLAEINPRGGTTFMWPYCDDCHNFLIPGKSWAEQYTNEVGRGAVMIDAETVWLSFWYFDEPVQVKGDFYLTIALKHRLPSGEYRFIDLNSPFLALKEYHAPPFHMDPSIFRLWDHNTDTWTSLDSSYYLPYIFLIIEPECKAVESVNVTTDANGCVTVEWDTLRYQRHWALRLDGPSGSQYDTVDTPIHTYCGLDSNATYTVSIQTQCYRPPDSLYWGSWSRMFPIGNNASSIVSPAVGRLSLSPNPAAGQVTVTAEGFEGEASLALFDASGSEVMRRENIRLPLTLSTELLPPGIYMVRLISENVSATAKLVVMGR